MFTGPSEHLTLMYVEYTLLVYVHLTFSVHWDKIFFLHVFL